MKSAEFDDNSFGLSLYPVNSRDAMPIYRPNYVTIIIQTLSILLCFFFYNLGRSLPHFERSHTSGYLSYYDLVKHVIYRKISTRISFCLYLVQTGRWETAISKVNFLVFHSLRIMD